jgi:hypothetical protein
MICFEFVASHFTDPQPDYCQKSVKREEAIALSDAARHVAHSWLCDADKYLLRRL